MTARSRRRASAVLAFSALLAVLAVPASRGEGAPPLAASGGMASASAVVTRVTPGVGSLQLGAAGGVALAKVTNQVAQAQSEFIDLGLIGAILVAAGGVDVDFLPDQLSVDNRVGDADARDEQPVVDGAISIGDRSVQARTTPSAAATSDLATTVGGLIDVSAGRAEASTDVIDATTREAHAVVTADVTLAGVVKLSGLRWEARHRTGEGAMTSATFSIGTASIGSVRVPTDATDVLGELINTALAPTGLTLELPTVEHTQGATDIVRITPLRIQLKDSSLGSTALGPVLDLSREQREQLYQDVNGRSASLGYLLLAADIGLTIAGGQGFAAIDIGGAEASSGDIVQQDVFGERDDAPPFAPSASATAGPPPLPVSGRVEPAVAVPPRTTVAAPATVMRCESTHEARPRGCRGGALVPLGVAGVLGAVGVGALDLRRQRRRRATLVATGVGSVGSTAVARSAGACTRRALRPYGLLMAVAAGFAVLAVSVAEPRAEVTLRAPATVPNVSRGPGQVAGGTAGEGTEGAALGIGGSEGSGTGGAGTTSACQGRQRQVPGDPYSPPCYAFSGDNGGATSVGVTKDTIRITVRRVEAGSATDIFVALAGQAIEDTTDSVAATLDALADYFSSRFQFYGRKLEIELFRGAGNGLNELLGGGRERAAADAVRAAELKPFADVSANTLPYADALAQNKIVNIGAPYPSRAWFEAREPYSWSLFPDGTNVVEATTSALVGRFKPGELAEYAGDALKGQPRRFGVVVPENPEYQESVNVFLQKLKPTGIQVALNIKYKLDLASMPNQASNIIAQLKDAGVTSVLCFCDPAMLAFGMTPKANEQKYAPEWVTAGIVFLDQDVVSQAVDQKQWAHAFGTAYNAESERIGASFPYAAYKSVRPNDEPALGVEELYYQMYLLAIGIQMAGPNLTPETFQAGLFAYPDAFGPRGTWGFGVGDHTPPDDYRELWWDPDRISTQNDRPGTWVQLNGGQRYDPSHPPTGRAPFFEG